PHHARGGAGGQARHREGADPGDAGNRTRHPDRAAGTGICDQPHACHASRKRPRPRADEKVRALRFQSARRPGAHPRRQGERPDERSRLRFLRRRARSRVARAASPRAAQLRGGGRAHRYRPHSRRHLGLGAGTRRVARWAARRRYSRIPPPCVRVEADRVADGPRISHVMTSPSVPFDEAFLRQLEHLAIVSRRPAAGHLRGSHRSRRTGTGMIFTDYRPYSAGDDTRNLDWGTYLRLDRLVLRLFEEEADLPIYIFLDTSRSMDFGAPTKFDFARRLAAALAYVGLINHDRVSV